MKNKLLLISIVLGLYLFSFSGNLAYGQSMEEVVAAFNQGAQLANNDPESAVQHFIRCVEIAEIVGEEASDTRNMAANQIPKLYYRIAVDYYKARDFQNAIKQFENTVEAGQKYGDSDSERKARSAIPQLYWALGNDHFNGGNYETALENYDKAIALMPTYAKAYLNKGKTYDKMNDLEKMKEAMDKAIGLSMGKDQATATEAEERVRINFYNAGVVAIQNKQWAVAEQYFNTSIEYGNQNPDIYLKLGEISNELGQNEKAISYLNRGLSLDTGDSSSKAGFYFHMGNAHLALNDSVKACEAYRKALFGGYIENAKYQIEQVLKCK